MSTSNVRNIETLEDFQAGLVRLAGRWDKSLQEIRIFVQRAETHFATIYRPTGAAKRNLPSVS